MAQARKVDAFDEEFSIVQEVGRIERPGRALIVRLLRHRTYKDLRVEARFFRVRSGDGREFATPQGFVVTVNEADDLTDLLSDAVNIAEQEA